MLTATYLDHLARRQLSRQQADLLVELSRLSATDWAEWHPSPSSRSESAVISRRVHRLAERGFVTLGADFARDRFTHLRLTFLGREVAAELVAPAFHE